MKSAPRTQFTGPELCALEAHQVVKLLHLGEVSPSEVLDAAFSRIDAVEPSVNAIVTRCEERARSSVSSLAVKGVKNVSLPGWLGGLPIGIKDLTPVAGVRTTFGNKGLASFVPEQSSALVERLENNGGIVVGKTNTPEFGAGGNTFNEVFGMTRNPWDTRKNAGGSSGGAAVSLATGEVWLSQGGDLAGSLRTPAAYCGVVGLRPSIGRVAESDEKFAFNTEIVPGPMARSVTDCALFLDAMSGFEPRSPLSLEAPRTPFMQAVYRASEKVRIAYSPNLNGFAHVTPEVDAVLRHALGLVEKAGAAVDEACPQLPDLEPTYVTLRAMVWAAGPGRAPAEVQKHFKQTVVENIEVGRKLKIDDVYDAQIRRTVLFHNMQQFLQSYDVLACPTVGMQPGPVEEEYPTAINGTPLTDYIQWLRFAFLATTTGLPAISIPIGFSEGGMPVGMQLIGRPRGEARLLQVARAIEISVGGPLKPIDPRSF
ncbi:amidase [Ensifer adhaerens]|uniref:amidase n=1 Tax=Ensifer adhaerens TaxID=106592 RepID=UPI001CBC9CC4|nr:amidase family protein [Ensifer adhaerens]MBZ7924817.1 amidase [Ensifer adhaerens]UAX95962.1 amidase [Ensifer adhaerens]UAY04696.1 amidase [Ensifer adhaerens]UAY10127.1 amidase [Ensifer adhaerens]